MNSDNCHLFYSDEAAEQHGTSIWRLEDGSEVEVTCADEDRDAPGYLWADKQYLGVGTFVRTGREGLYAAIPDQDFVRRSFAESFGTASKALRGEE